MKKNGTLILILFFIIEGCKEAYTPILNTPANGYLIVEGYINANGQSTVRLTKSTSLNVYQIIPEKNAKIYIESDSKDNINFRELEGGYYTSPVAYLESGKKFRLHIFTHDNKEYVSEYSEVLNTPPIDSIRWERKHNGLQLYTYSHTKNSVKYYNWQYKEVWEIRSSQISYLKYNNTETAVIYRKKDSTVDTSIYRCWRNNNSVSIILGASTDISGDLLKYPIRFIESTSDKLKVLYRIEVTQTATDQKGYTFLNQMKKNTEKLGSIFDAQPTELSGNIKCVNNEKEIVIGYILPVIIQKKVLFLSPDDVGGWSSNFTCDSVTITNNSASISNAILNGLQPTTIASSGLFGIILSFNASKKECVDCTLSGSNTKPDFWPN